MVTHLFSPSDDMQGVGEGHPTEYLLNYMGVYLCSIIIRAFTHLYSPKMTNIYILECHTIKIQCFRERREI